MSTDGCLARSADKAIVPPRIERGKSRQTEIIPPQTMPFSRRKRPAPRRSSAGDGPPADTNLFSDSPRGQQRLRVLSKLRDERYRAACKWAECLGSVAELLRLVGSSGLLLRELAIT